MIRRNVVPPLVSGACPPARAFGGAEETRTPDFLLAKEALYQLSYSPEAAGPLRGCCTVRARSATHEVQTEPHAAKPRQA